VFDYPRARDICGSINKGGTIAGLYVSSDYVYHGFIRAPDGTLTSFDAPNATGTAGDSVNDDGTVTGEYFDANDTTTAMCARPTEPSRHSIPNIRWKPAGRYRCARRDHGYYQTPTGSRRFIRKPDGRLVRSTIPMRRRPPCRLHEQVRHRHGRFHRRKQHHARLYPQQVSFDQTRRRTVGASLRKPADWAG